KLKADKMIPIPLVLYRIMRFYIDKKRIRAREYIFKGQDGGAYRVGSFMKMFKKYCTKSNIDNGDYLFKSHDYRHTLATRFYEDGVSIQTIRDYLGHFNEEMTKQYIDYMPRRIAKANEELFEKSGNPIANAITVKKRGDGHEK
ncbi:MAG: tyrosine-type recombinase/integrase, partial [Lachnospiraceae bacterium]|nr:tyrosine-type recombinase/integrase [Lachnospiraceae bacterium]